MNCLPQNGVLQRMAARWMSFENRAFERIMKTERRVRRIPPHVRMHPAQFDRRLFRVFVGACVSLVLIAALVPADSRPVVILVFLLVLFLVALALTLIDTFPRKSR